MDQSNKILILGSGLMVEPLIDYLLKRNTIKITLAANIYEVIKNIVKKKNSSRLIGVEIDVMKEQEKLVSIISEHDLVVSYVPPNFHVTVAKACLKAKRNMIHASYQSPELRKFDEEFKKNDLVMMGEIGLDPGIDHLITHKVIHECEKKGDKIVGFESWCGALASPEAMNNPLHYKITWAPRSCLTVLNNAAKQMKNGKVLDVKAEDLLLETTHKKFHPCFNFEGYYNRDSMPYKEMYGLKDAKTVIRGTLRFGGFSYIFYCFKKLKLVLDEKIPDNMRDYKSYLLAVMKGDEHRVEEMRRKYLTTKDEFFLRGDDDEDAPHAIFYRNVVLYALSFVPVEYIKKFGFKDCYERLYNALRFLELYDREVNL